MTVKHNREKGTGSIEKRNGRFYLKLRINGTSRTTLLRDENDNPVTTRKAAEEAAKRMRPILRAQQKEEIAVYIAEARKMKHEQSVSIEDIWTTYLAQYDRPDSGTRTLKRYQECLACFIHWLKDKHPEIILAKNITTGIAGEFFAYLWSEKKVSGRTYNAYRQALRLIFKHILELTALENNPFDLIKTKSMRTESRKPFTEEQIKAIFDGFESGFYYKTLVGHLGPNRTHIKVEKILQFKPMYADEMRVLLYLCCWTGCRGYDGCHMQWNNVDMVGRTITYIPHKTAVTTNYRAVTLPLHPLLYTALQDAEKFRARNKENEDYILPSIVQRCKYNQGGVHRDVIKIIQCATGCAATSQKLGEHRIRKSNVYGLHSFRHTFVSFCANAGVPLDVVASIVGHGSTAMTRHYAHISDEAKGKAIEALPVLETLQEEVHDPDRELLLKQLSGLSTEELAKLVSNTITNSTDTKDLKAG